MFARQSTRIAGEGSGGDADRLWLTLFPVRGVTLRIFKGGRILQPPDQPGHRADEDGELLRLLRADPDVGFPRVVEAHGGTVAGQLRARFRGASEETIQDVIYDAVFQVWRRLGDGASIHSLRGYLLRTAQRALVATIRADHIDVTLGIDLDRIARTDRRDVDARASQIELLLEELPGCIQRLEAREQDVVRADLADGFGASTAALATRWSTTEANIRQIRRRARKRLGRFLEEVLR